MGSIAYHFLTESILFDKSLQNENFRSIPESSLKMELEKYRQHVLSNIVELTQEIQNESSRLKLFGDQDYFSTPHLMQTALYLDQIILPDPIFALSKTTSEISSNMSKFLGMPKNDGIDRKALAIAASKMKTLTPMIACDYLKFFPVSYYAEPSEHIPLTFSSNGYSDALPPEILSIYRDKVEVRSLRKSDNGWIVEDSLNRGRGIAIQFAGDDTNHMHIYHLFENEVVKMDEDTRIVQFRMTLPDALPSTEQFEGWINQSTNQAARGHYAQLYKGLMLSSNFGASYLTSSDFTHSLLGSRNPTEDIESYTSDCVLNLELPFLKGISIDDLMSVRRDDGEAFELFRRELESRFRELRTETDPEILSRKIQNLFHELNEVQVTKINQKVKSMKKGALASSVIAVGGLAGSVVTSGWSIAATIVALANGFQTYSTFREKVKENPSYFLWKVKHQ